MRRGVQHYRRGDVVSRAATTSSNVAPLACGVARVRKFTLRRGPPSRRPPGPAVVLRCVPAQGTPAASHDCARWSTTTSAVPCVVPQRTECAALLLDGGFSGNFGPLPADGNLGPMRVRECPSLNRDGPRACHTKLSDGISRASAHGSRHPFVKTEL